MDDKKFTLFMKLSARRKEEGAVTDVKTSSIQEHADATGGTTGPAPHGGAVSSETPVTGGGLFCKIMHDVRTCVKKDGWRDEAAYGDLIALRDIPEPGSCIPTVESLQTLSEAMEKGEGDNENENKLFRVRKAAHDVMAVARDGWLKSAELCPVLEDLDIFRKLHSAMIGAGHSDLPFRSLVCLFIGSLRGNLSRGVGVCSGPSAGVCTNQQRRSKQTTKAIRRALAAHCSGWNQNWIESFGEKIRRMLVRGRE